MRRFGAMVGLLVLTGCLPLGLPLVSDEEDALKGERPSTPGAGLSTTGDGDGDGDGDSEGTGDGDGDGDGDPCEEGTSPGNVCLWAWDVLAAGGVPTGIDAARLGADQKTQVAAAMFTGDGMKRWSVGPEWMLESESGPDYGDGFRDVAFVDLNDDGILDLVGAHPQLNVVVMAPGDGQGGFGAAETVGVDGGPRALVVADLHGDGRDELIVVRQSAGIRVLTYGVDGFEVLQTWDGQGVFYDAASGDLDLDGREDLALVDEGGDQIILFRGMGDGTLSPMGAVGVGDAPRGVAVGDLTGDGVLDLVVTTFGDDRMTSFVGSLDGATVVYEERSAVALGIGPYTVRLADMDLDGILDAVTPISGLGAVGIVLTDGTGTLGERIPFLTGSSPIDVLVRDLDQDEVPDLIVSNAGAQSLVLLGSRPSG